jgi:hypothetical protein
LFLTHQRPTYEYLYLSNDVIKIDLENDYHIEKIYIHGEKRYIVNLTDHEKLLGLDKGILLWPQPIVQARIEKDEDENGIEKIYYYMPYGNYKKDIIFMIGDFWIQKNDPTVIKIVSKPTVEYWASILKCKIKDVIFKYGWVYPSFTRENPYYFVIL